MGIINHAKRIRGDTSVGRITDRERRSLTRQYPSSGALPNEIESNGTCQSRRGRWRSLKPSLILVKEEGLGEKAQMMSNIPARIGIGNRRDSGMIVD